MKAIKYGSWAQNANLNQIIRRDRIGMPLMWRTEKVEVGALRKYDYEMGMDKIYFINFEKSQSALALSKFFHDPAKLYPYCDACFMRE